MDLDRSFSLYLELLMKCKRLSFKRIADVTHHTDGAVRRWINDGHVPRNSAQVAGLLCNAYQLPDDSFEASSVFVFAAHLGISPRDVFSFKLKCMDYTKLPFLYSLITAQSRAGELDRYVGYFILYRFHDDDNYQERPIIRLPCKVYNENGVFKYADRLNRDYGSPPIEYIGYMFWLGGLITIIGEEGDANHSREIFWCTLNQSGLTKPSSLTGIVSGIDTRGSPASYKTLLVRVKEDAWAQLWDSPATSHFISEEVFAEETASIINADRLIKFTNSDQKYQAISAPKIN